KRSCRVGVRRFKSGSPHPLPADSPGKLGPASGLVGLRRAQLIRQLALLEGFTHPRAELEQVITPPEAAAEIVRAAEAREDLVGRTVLDLGCGTGLLAIAAKLGGAASVVGIDSDPAALDVARRNAELAHVEGEFRLAEVSEFDLPADTVVMNPPFGAQRRHADRPFWEAALRLARRRIYAFALDESRTFIARRTVDSGGRIEETRPVHWVLPATFAHHTRRRVELRVDLWVLRPPHP
ncbi:MAG: METTL5 family protein, partial [Thermoplasmata archaeon]|nr:METTL5 family protein [Thermoplasmata archaeon]